MTNLINHLLEEIDAKMMRTYRRPTKITVTSDFANDLVAKCPYDLMLIKDNNAPKGYTNQIFGIPLEIDNDINDNYKIIYEEE